MTTHRDFGEHREGEKRGPGHTPKYRAFHEVYITKDLGSKRNEEVKTFIGLHIEAHKGKAVDKHGIPEMLFEVKADAERFAKELSTKLGIPKEHIEVKAQKFNR
jgi:hypothetical protein